MQMTGTIVRGIFSMWIVAAAVELALGAPPEPQKAPASAPTTASAPAATRPANPPPMAKVEPKMIPLSFNNAPLAEISKFLSDQMGKPVMVSKEIMNVQITVMNPKPLPVPEAMYVLTATLHEAGVAIEERAKTVHLIPITQIAQAQLLQVGAENDMSTLEPANQIIRKTFITRHYDAAKLVDVIKPLLPNWSYITADPASGKLMVVATVERLRVIAGVIQQVDAPDVSGGELRVFPIKNVDVNEILPMLEKLISGYLGVEVKAVTSAGTSAGGRGQPDRGGGQDPRMMGDPRMSSPDRGGPPSPPGGGTMTVKAEKMPVLIIPEPRRSAIVVVAPANVLAQVEKWLAHLDQPQPPSTQQELVEVRYTDPDALVAQLTGMLNNMLDEGLRNSVRILPFASSRRIMIIGSEQNRSQIKRLLKEIDVPAGATETRTFTLKNADAQQIAENIKELFQEQQQTNRYWYYYDRPSSGSDKTKVTVTHNARNNSVTVVAPPERMSKIAEQILEWDKPLDTEDAEPRIFDLKYSDPEKTKTLLENLFTKKEQSNPFSRYFFGGDMPEAQASPVGRLFGQFRFEAYPETGKLVVVSKNEENYAVIEKMIAEIDRPQSVGIPRIIQLKFADAETLAEQLNALLNAPGTPAAILRRGQTGTFQELTDHDSPYSTNTNNQNQNRPQQQQQPTRNTSEIQFWWQQPPSDLIKNRQPSNLVGKLRIVPNVEQNLLMVVAPEEYADAIEKFVTDLDQPGQQVLVKGLIAEITHDDTTSLGYRFSTDPTTFTTGSDVNITENALRGLLNYKFEDMFGHQNTVTFNMDVNNLVSLLRRVTDLKIRSEPKVFTADNVEAEFFDGQDIPFIKDSNINGINGQSQSFDYKAVGIRLRVRPHITKERNVDLTINLLVSSVIPGRTLFGGAIVDRRETTTRIVLEDGKTFLISGILREEEREIIRRIPGLGDVPVLGEIFKHREIAKVNTELLIFLTPCVIGARDSRDPIESDPLQRLDDKMNMNSKFGPPADAGHKKGPAIPASVEKLAVEQSR